MPASVNWHVVLECAAEKMVHERGDAGGLAGCDQRPLAAEEENEFLAAIKGQNARRVARKADSRKVEKVIGEGGGAVGATGAGAEDAQLARDIAQGQGVAGADSGVATVQDGGAGFGDVEGGVGHGRFRKVRNQWRCRKPNRPVNSSLV